MNKIKPLTFLLLLILLPGYLWAKIDNYNYKRELSGISDRWHTIVLPDEIYGKTLQNLNDIRIFGITDSEDTIEVPYILNVQSPEISSDDYSFELINNNKIGNTYFYTFKTDQTKTINRIQLEFENQNFDWHITLKGSNNQNTWYTIVEDYRILSIKNDEIDYNYTILNFDPAQYKFYKLEIPANEKPKLLKANLSRQVQKNGISDTITIDHSNLDISKKDHHTEIKIQLPEYIRASGLNINIKEDFEYYRDLTIKYIKDSIKTETGWIYEKRILTNATLSSLRKDYFSFPDININNFIIDIKNGNNPPLSVENVNIICYQHELIARFTQNARYYLCYGNQYAYRPNYDIENFKSSIPQKLTSIKIGQEEKINKPEKLQTKPLFNKYWLWSIMGVIIILLGWSSKQLLNKSKE